MSTLSHSFNNPRLRSFFRALDQGTIYLLIAGTYTPFSMAYLNTPVWNVVLGIVWLVAIGGFLSKVAFTHRVESVSAVPCLVLGGIQLIAIPTVLPMVGFTCLAWMVGGIVCYIDRPVVLAQRQPRPPLPRRVAPAGDRRQHVPLHGHPAVRRPGLTQFNSNHCCRPLCGWPLRGRLREAGFFVFVCIGEQHG